MSSTQGCLIIPFFEGLSGVYPEYHVGAGCWAFHSYLINSNVIEKQIPLFFYIERAVWELATTQLKAAGIPEDRMIQWQAPPREKWTGQFYAQKLYATLDPFFDAYGTVVMVESDIFLATATQEKFDISKLFNKHINPERYATAGMTEDLVRMPRHYLYYGLPDEESYALFQSLAKERLGIEVEQVHRSDGGFGAWSPAHLSDIFKEFVLNHARYFGSEEDVNSLYVQWSGERMDDLVDMWEVWLRRTGNNMAEVCDMYDYILFHIRSYRMPEENDRAYFRTVVGQNKTL